MAPHIALRWICHQCVLYTHLCGLQTEIPVFYRHSPSSLFTNTPWPCIPHKHAYALMLPTLNTLASALPRLSHVSLCLFLSLLFSLLSLFLTYVWHLSVHALHSSCLFLVYSVFFCLFLFILAWLPVFYHFIISLFSILIDFPHPCMRSPFSTSPAFRFHPYIPYSSPLPVSLSLSLSLSLSICL